MSDKTVDEKDWALYVFAKLICVTGENMGKKIIFCFTKWCGENYTVELVPLKRKSIYGERKIAVLDSENKECKSCYLGRNGSQIYPSGGTTICSFNDDGTYKESKPSKADDSEVADFESGYGDNQYSSFQIPNLLEEYRNQNNFLATNLVYPIKAVYTLEEYDVYQLLEMIGEKIFTFSFYSKPKSQGEISFIFKRNEKLFMTITDYKNYSTHTEYSSQKKINKMNDNLVVYDTLDDIDFEIL